MSDNLKRGDEVEWETSQGTTRGKVVEEVTAPAKVKGYRAAASKDRPEYLVESEKTGARAIHKPTALKKAGATSKGPKAKAAPGPAPGGKAPEPKAGATPKRSSAKKSPEDVIAEFREVVNMTPAAIEKWLKTEESRSVGQKKGGRGESTGHESGRRIVALLRDRSKERSDDDLAHMRKVISYVRRHSAQGPEGGVETSPWRYSLMNWGHDPLKK